MKSTFSFAFKRGAAALAAASVAVCALLPAGGVVWAEETTTAESSDTFDDGTLTYKKLSNTTVSVTDCVESATHISIMPKIDGYDIVSIGEEAFANCTSLQSVTIPASVTEIGSAAFYGCTALTKVTVPDAVTKIEQGTFFSCTALTDLTLGKDTTEIGDMAFGYCTSLETVTLPDTVETLGDQLFYYCTALDEVQIPEKVTELGGYTFYGCMSLKSFTVPKNLENIGAMSFVACPSLETIAVEDGNTKYQAVDNVLYDTEESILYLYPAGRTDTSFTLPESTLVVYAGAFFAAGNLQQINFDEKLQYIGEMAFDFCSGLTSLTIPKAVTTIGTTAFADCTGLTSVTFSGASDEDGGEGGDLEIGDYAFFCDDNLKEVQLPKRVSSVGKYAFGCTSPADDDDSEDYVTVSSDSGDNLKVKALDGFLLIGYTGAASDYVKDCDVKISFKAMNVNWKAVMLWGILAVVLVAVLLIAIRLIRRNMMTAEEKKALQEAEAEHKIPLSQRDKQDEAAEEKPEYDDGYRSILDDDDEDAAEEVADYEQTISHSQLHHIGHADMPAAEDEKKDEE
ncbi:leucine-rich repeat domain-containing protein [Ruminococcus sp.]